jgi:hypothetical protein
MPRSAALAGTKPGCPVETAGGAPAVRTAKDPGPRGGAAGAGSYYPALNPSEQAAFAQAPARFQEIDSVSGTLAGESRGGFGRTFNEGTGSIARGRNVGEQLMCMRSRRPSMPLRANTTPPEYCSALCSQRKG